MEHKTACKPMLYNLFPCKPGGGSPRKKGPKSAAPSKTHMPSVKTTPDKKQDEVSEVKVTCGKLHLLKCFLLSLEAIEIREVYYFCRLFIYVA